MFFKDENVVKICKKERKEERKRGQKLHFSLDFGHLGKSNSLTNHFN